MPVQTTYSDAPDIGYPGMPASPDNNQYTWGRNAEASAKIPFGHAVKLKTSAPTTPNDVLLPAAETDDVLGIVVRLTNVELAWTDAAGVVHGQYDASGFLPGAYLNVATKGKLLVTAEDAVANGDKLWVRCTAGGAGEVVGGLTNADEGTETIDCTNAGRWRSPASAGGLAWLEFDFSGDMT